MSYRLTREADRDIEAILEDGIDRFGHARAVGYIRGLERAFEDLAAFPRMAQERTEAKPAVRLRPYGSHLILYRLEGDDVLVLRVRHGREDWRNGEEP